MIIWRPTNKAYPTLLPSDPIIIGGASISPTQIMILVLTAISLAVLTWLVNYTKLGRAMRATAENPRVASLMGIRPDMVISATFIIGADLKEGRLQVVLPDHPPTDLGIYALYAPNRYMAAKTRLFIDFLVERFGETPEWDDFPRPD